MDIAVIKKNLDEALLETIWSDNGVPTFIIKDGLDLSEYADISKTVLENDKPIAHDFTGTVTNASKREQSTFEYRSGWFLDGIADGEIE